MGRPKGSRNLTAEEREQRLVEKANKPKGKRGRPKGSLNKPKGTIPAQDTPVEEEKVELAVKQRGKPNGRKRGYTVSEKALAQRRKNGALPVPTTTEERDYNSRLIDHVIRVQEIATHADRHDLLSLRSCFMAYLKVCQEDGFCVSNLSAYTAMGMTIEQFKGFARKEDPEVRAFVAFIKTTCAMFRESMVADSKINPVIGIFWQRNYDGLRNDTEQVQSAQALEEESFDRNGSYKDKYKKLIGG